jgi:hypothetical protein
MFGESPKLNFYGLLKLGFTEDQLALTGRHVTDQLYIESLCHRISHKPEEGGLGPAGHFLKYVDLLWNNPELGSSKRYIHNSWGDQMIEEACGEMDPRALTQLGVAGCTSAGKSDPFALYAVGKYLIDPTHTLVLVMSTTLTGAKKRIWKTIKEYWNAIPNFPGRPLWSTNEIKGLSYDGVNYGDSSGIYLFASEQSNEKSALDKLIGVKAPRTGEPDESYENLRSLPENQDLVESGRSEDQLRDLLKRLSNLSDNRIGQLIVIIDEATGCSESILNALRTNLLPGNVGHCQVIMLGNPNSHFDTFGLFCAPEDGWQTKGLEDESWTTAGGGRVVRFDGEHNPRIVDRDERCSWMLRKEDILNFEKDYGKDSLFYWRMVHGMWYPKGVESGVYSEADLMFSGAMNKVTWGFRPPVKLSSLDPSFTQGGDRAMATFFNLGVDANGKQVLERTESIGIKVDMDNTQVPVSHQIVRKWKKLCSERGIAAMDASCDITGAPSFGDIVRIEWSPQVMLINSGGKAPKAPWGREKGPDGKPVMACDRFHNKATYIWYSALPFLRSGQIFGVTPELAKEMCSRQHAKQTGQDSGRLIRIEDKRVYKSREGKSPDESDSFFLGVELAVVRHGFKPNEKSGVDDSPAARGKSVGTWKQFCDKARRMTKTVRNLKGEKS